MVIESTLRTMAGMDILEFLARSEWPIVALVAVLVIRKPLGRMVDRVNPKKVDAWGFKAEFEKRLEKAELLVPPQGKSIGKSSNNIHRIVGTTSADDAGLSLSSSSNETLTWSSGGVSIDAPASIRMRYNPVDASPEMAILTAWNQVEKAIRDAGIKRGVESAKPWTSWRVIEEMARRVQLGPDEISALKELRDLRNHVAHTTDIGSVTPLDAKRYIDVAQRFRAQLGEDDAP